MNHDAFRPLLLRCTVAAMVCDGEVHETEVEELRRMVDELPHFAGTDTGSEFSGVLDDLTADPDGAIAALLADVMIAAVELREPQKVSTLEALLNVVGADGIVHPSEAAYVRQLKAALGVTDETFIVSFPANIGVLYDGDAALPGLRLFGDDLR